MGEKNMCSGKLEGNGINGRKEERNKEGLGREGNQRKDKGTGK